MSRRSKTLLQAADIKQFQYITHVLSEDVLSLFKERVKPCIDRWKSLVKKSK